MPAADLKFQHKIYMGIIAVVNLAFIINGVLFPLAAMNIIIVGTPHFRDLLYMLLRVIFSRCKFVSWSADAADSSSSRGRKSNKRQRIRKRKANVVAVIPAYKEDPEEVELTLNSIGSQVDDNMRIAQVIVSDGFLDYHEIIDELHEIVSFPYTTYKRDKNRCSILMGYYKGMKVCVAKKKKNAGKKDSLVVTDDIFIKRDEHFSKIQDAILQEFHMESCDYIFHTDADSVIGDGAFRRMINALESNEKIAAVAGLVLVPFESFSKTGFWNFFQGFQYYYGQVIRKATESLWGKVTCLPGCITMVRAQHPAVVAACDRYNKLPSSNFIFQIKNRLQGTDRRYTNCVTQYSADTYLVVDMWSDCFTVPPQSMDHFRSQRKRWTSNAITGNWFLMFGSNVPIYTRILCGIDIFRIHTSVTRFCCTVQFFLALGMKGADLTTLQLTMLALVLILPYIFFLSTIINRGKYGGFLFVGSIISKICSPFITVYIFLYASKCGKLG